MHTNETTEGVGAAQLHESSRAAEAACTSRNSLPSQCSKCEKQPATAGCEVYTSCTVTKQAPSSLHCSQARLCIVARRGRRGRKRKKRRRAQALAALEEEVVTQVGYVAPMPTVEVVQVADNGIVIKKRLLT